MSQYLNPNIALERLRNEWAKYGKLIIAFDVDSTIMPFHQNEYKYDYEPVRQLLRDLRELGCILIVFTASPESRWNKIKEELENADVPWDYFNITPKTIKEGEEFVGQGIKVYANAYLDDRAGLHEVYSHLTQLVLERKLEQMNDFTKGLGEQLAFP
jgi:type I restriction-modification system DNA methylase subunit